MRSAVVLPQPGRADENHELSVFDLELDVRDRPRSVGIDLADVLERDLSQANPLFQVCSYQA